MKANGYGGAIRVGYQQAARVIGWSLDVTPTVPMIRFAITAAVRSVDPFWMTQAPLALDLRFGIFHWRWDSVTLKGIEDGTALMLVFGRPTIEKDGEV